MKLTGSGLVEAVASGLYDAGLGYEEMVIPLKKQGKLRENHAFAAASLK